MRIKEFILKVEIPILEIALVMMIVYPLCVENGVCNYWKWWIAAGIPFGVQKMYFWMIPKGFDIGGTVGMFVLNLLLGGLIGGAVLVWKLILAGMYLVKGIVTGSVWVANKIFVK